MGPPPRPHFPCFDGLRGFAALAVLFLHVAWEAGYTNRSGYGHYVGRLEVGVSVFFLISGFLLYRPYAVAHLSGRHGPVLRKFWQRRLLRMIPAYWLALTVITYVFHTAKLPGWQGILANYGFAQIYFPKTIFSGIEQAWSVCTEMSFYIFLPAYAFVVSHPPSLLGQLRRELIGIVTLICISFGFRNWALHQPLCTHDCFTHPTFAALTYSWLPSYLDLFALGIFLAVMSAWFAEHRSEPTWLRHPAMPWVSWSIAFVTFFYVSNLGIPGSPLYLVSPALNMFKQFLYGVVAFTMLLPAVFGPQEQGLIRRLLRSWPVAALGVVSYGVYVWHIAWIDRMFKWKDYYTQDHVPLWNLLLPVVVLSIIVAAASYFIIELPALELKDRSLGELLPAGIRTRIALSRDAVVGWRHRPAAAPDPVVGELSPPTVAPPASPSEQTKR